MEEQPLQSLIGKLHYLGQSGANLIKENIYLYKNSYIVPKHDGGFGKLETIASPSLPFLEWPMWIDENIMGSIRNQIFF